MADGLVNARGRVIWRGFEILLGLLLIPVALFFYLWSFRMKERKDAAWKRAAAKWLEAEKLMDTAKASIRALAGEESCYGGGVKHLYNLKAGNVQYKQIPELRGVDLDQYRRPGHFESRVSAI